MMQLHDGDNADEDDNDNDDDDDDYDDVDDDGSCEGCGPRLRLWPRALSPSSAAG